MRRIVRCLIGAARRIGGYPVAACPGGAGRQRAWAERLELPYLSRTIAQERGDGPARQGARRRSGRFPDRSRHRRRSHPAGTGVPERRSRHSTSRRCSRCWARSGIAWGRLPWPRLRRAPLRRHGAAEVIVDTSVVVAILHRQQEGPAFAFAMASAPARRLSAASHVELAAVVDGRRDPVTSGVVDSVLRALRIRLRTPGPAHHGRLLRRCARTGPRRAAPVRGQDFVLTDIELTVEPIRSRRLSEVVAAYTAEAR